MICAFRETNGQRADSRRREGRICEKLLLSQTLTTFDLFIPIDYSVIASAEYTGVSYVGDDALTVFNPILKQNENKPNEFRVDTLWGPDFIAAFYGNEGLAGQYPYAGRIIINDDTSLTIYGIESYATGGSGFYDPCTNTFKYTLSNSIPDEGDVLSTTPVNVELTAESIVDDA